MEKNLQEFPDSRQNRIDLEAVEAANAGAVLLEICARSSAKVTAIAEVASTCARDVGQALRIARFPIRTQKESVITLHLPADKAASQHEVWCLACRLACFCPEARVCVLVQGQAAFADAGQVQTSRISA